MWIRDKADHNLDIKNLAATSYCAGNPLNCRDPVVDYLVWAPLFVNPDTGGSNQRLQALQKWHLLLLSLSIVLLLADSNLATLLFQQFHCPCVAKYSAI